jgi:DNA-binding NarL/FixJ family response regulator
VVNVVLTHPMRAWVEALETLLEPRWDIEVVAAHTSPKWVRHAVVTLKPDLLLTHVAPPVSELTDMVGELFAAHPALRVVALSESPEPFLVTGAVRAGVRGWVQLTDSVDHMVRVLHGVARGESWFPPPLVTHVIDELLESAESREKATAVLSALSSRELEVLECLAQGQTRTQIAERYFLSPHTVRTHINNVLRKLDVHTTLAAVSIARQVGLAEGTPRDRGLDEGA